jgi:signal peptidase I
MTSFNKKEIWEFVKLVVLSLAIILPIRMYIAQPFIVSGSSMDPTFFNGDYLVVDEISYQFGQPKRGEVIVFRYPLDPSKFFIKRVVGLPGETININDGIVTIKNGEHPEGFILKENYENGVTLPDSYKKLGEKEYYVMGDNRAFSADSRYWGTLNEEYIIGRALVRLWPIGNVDLWPGLAQP